MSKHRGQNRARQNSRHNVSLFHIPSHFVQTWNWQEIVFAGMFKSCEFSNYFFFFIFVFYCFFLSSKFYYQTVSQFGNN